MAFRNPCSNTGITALYKGRMASLVQGCEAARFTPSFCWSYMALLSPLLHGFVALLDFSPPFACRKRVSAVAVLSLNGIDDLHSRMLVLQRRGCSAWQQEHMAGNEAVQEAGSSGVSL